MEKETLKSLRAKAKELRSKVSAAPLSKATPDQLRSEILMLERAVKADEKALAKKAMKEANAKPLEKKKDYDSGTGSESEAEDRLRRKRERTRKAREGVAEEGENVAKAEAGPETRNERQRRLGLLINKEELIFKVKGTGCKMLDGIEIDKMNMTDMCEYLGNSCCPALEDLIKEAEKSLH